MAEFVTLEITKKQARVLATILGFVSGLPSGPRGEASDIGRYLEAEGIEPYEFESDLGNIQFPDFWPGKKHR